jgi:pSer/pThr/pTyr-binding forkhead associated (FHA) protein
MSNALLLIDANTNTLIFQCEKNKFSVGRVEGNDLVIAHETISRFHAEFLKVGQDWAVVDLGSTNGTLLNEEQISPEIFSLTRAGDNLQFGDINIIVSEEGSIRSIPSIYVFNQTKYQGEFPISENTDFTFGGMNATIPSDELDTSDLIFIIRQDQEGLLLLCKHQEYFPTRNGESVSGRVRLFDRDILTIGSLYFLVSDRNSDKVKKVIEQIQSNLPQNSSMEKEGSSGVSVKLPSYLKGRVGEDGWEDPLEKKRKRTQTMFSLDSNSDGNEERKGSSLRSQAELVGIQRFSMQSLDTVKFENERKRKKQALLGAASLFVILIMLLILFDLYKDLFLGSLS